MRSQSSFQDSSEGNQSYEVGLYFGVFNILYFSLHVECLVYGNCTAESAMEIYTGLVDRLKQQCGTKLVVNFCVVCSWLTWLFSQGTSSLTADQRKGSGVERPGQPLHHHQRRPQELLH